MPTDMPDLVSADTVVDSSFWLSSAQQAVRSFCGWHIAPSFQQTLRLDAYGAATLLLPSLHVTKLLSLVFNGAEHVDDVDWSTSGTLQLRNGLCFPDAPGSVTVVIEHGFNASEVAEVCGLILKVAQRSSNGPGVIASQSTNGSSVSFFTAGGGPLSVPLLQIEKEMLEPYRITWGAS